MADLFMPLDSKYVPIIWISASRIATFSPIISIYVLRAWALQYKLCSLLVQLPALARSPECLRLESCSVSQDEQSTFRVKVVVLTNQFQSIEPKKTQEFPFYVILTSLLNSIIRSS